MMKDMGSSGLEDLCSHINEKISNIKKCILLRDIGEHESCKSVLCRIQHEVVLVHDLLNTMEAEVKQQEKLKDLLKILSDVWMHVLHLQERLGLGTGLLMEIQKAAEKDQKEAQHLLEHIPPYLPKPAQNCITVKHEGQTKAVEPKSTQKHSKETKVIKEAALITAEEFESVPVYMKGRITYDQVNAVVQQMNKAVVEKYKILYQPLKSMSAPARSLYHRFIEEETNDTKGIFFSFVSTKCVTLGCCSRRIKILLFFFFSIFD
uniref:SKA complex subunit 1 n=1 Tax=Cyanistes caeruleus TaxID=156563 RepID=A0A8C0V8I0_CYACU